MTSRVRSSLCSAPSTKAWTEQDAISMVSAAVLQSFASGLDPASNRWLDVYIGGGFEPDVCISATYADKRIDGDKLSFSLLAAGGVQFNITKWLGLYVEPELSWTAPSKNRKLETYRTVYPVMFSVSTGLRFNL